MKKFAILFLCLIFMCSFALPAFAATSCEEWLNDAQIDEVEKLAENIFSSEVSKATETHVYPMYHITDDAFFEKSMLWNEMSSFISQKYGFGIFSDSKFCEEPSFANGSYRTQGKNLETIFTLNIEEYQKFNEFLVNVDSYINAGEFGNVENVSLLYYDLENIILDEEETSLYLCFAYIESEDDEFLVPYTFLQTFGEQVLENGKIYTTKECAQAMREKISIGNGGSTEYLKTVLSIVGVILLLGGLGVVFVLVLKKKTKKHTSYDFFAFL